MPIKRNDEKPVSDAELERRLREMSDEELDKLPKPPSLEAMKDAVVMEEDDPERFKKLMGEGSGDSPMEIVGRAISSLPDRLADRLGAP